MLPSTVVQSPEPFGTVPTIRQSCFGFIGCPLLYTRRVDHSKWIYHHRSSFHARGRVYNHSQIGPSSLPSLIASPRDDCVCASSRTLNQNLSSFCSWTLTLLCGAGAWSCLRSSSLWAGLVLLAVEAVYVGLHIKPLMPLVGEGKADESSNNFMICYTTPHFFATEVLLFLVLFETQGWSGIPLYLLWIHAAFHIVYTVLSGAFPAWCIQQNIERVQGSAPKDHWRAAWDLTLNMLNVGDALLHVLYIYFISAAIHTGVSSGNVSSAAVELWIAGFLLAGGALYYILGELVPNAVRLEKSSRPSAANSAQSM